MLKKFKYKGHMVNDQKKGSGQLYDNNGLIKYFGNFSKDKYNGKGILYNNMHREL